MISHLRLNTTKTLSQHVSMQVDDNGFEFIVLNHPNFDAAFSLHGAHLVHFQAKQHAPLIYLSKTALFNSSKAIRGGVPVCWPWFGNTTFSKSNNLPGHGFARISQWTVSNLNETDKGIDISFSLTSTPSTKTMWDHDFELTLTASLSDHVELTLATKNSGDASFTYAGALHTYLNIADIEHCKVEGLANTYSDSLDNKQIKTDTQPLLINKPIDSIYALNTGNIIVEDINNQREIVVRNQGNDTVVVWNPWIEGAKAFADMPDDGYKTMLCIEAAITSETGVVVEPGQSHTLKTIIK
jgi:glucose-6-phosphate 1-epimerase